MSISEPFIRRPIATTLLMAAVAFAGIVSFPFLPVAPLPQVDFPTIQISATWAGASAENMGTSVAAPLERQLAEISGISQLTSLSTLGSTSITIQFDLNRNIDAAAQDVQAAITTAGKSLPQSMTTPPSYRKVNPADAPILMLSLQSDTVPLTQMDDYADLFMAQQISQVTGVSQVSIFGTQTPSIRVQVDPAKLAATGLTLEDMRTALVNSTTNIAKGTINTPTSSFTIATNDQLSTPEPYNDVILAYRNGAPIRVRDVGQAVTAAVDRTVAAYQNNKPGIVLAIFKQPGANVVDTVDQIKAQLPQLTANIPPSINVTTVVDRTTTIRASVADVEFTLALTIGLVVAVILLFLRNFWATFIPSITVPLALMGSAAVMYLLGFSLDNLSLMALTVAVGFVVDDAIVVVENIYRHVENGETALDAALKGSREIGFTVLSISVSLVAVFIPLLLMGGIVGRLFREFALTVTASIAVSAFVSLTLAPMLCSRFLTQPNHHHGRIYGAVESVLEGIASFYARTLDVVLRHQPITLCVFFATIALTGFMAVEIPKGFFPIQDTGMASAFIEAAQDATPQQMMQYTQEVGKVILADPDVAAMASSTGGTGGGSTANTGRAFISFKPRDERTLSASQIIDRLRPQLAKIEGVTTTLQPTQDINVGGRTSRGQFQYTLQDTNTQELGEWSNKMLAKLKTLPELADVSSDLLANAPQLKITINRDQAARFGITPAAIDDTLNDAFGQREITQYLTQLKTYFVVLEILPELQNDLTSLRKLYVKSPLTGAAVPLASLVDVDSTNVGPLSVAHQGQFPAATLSFNLQPGVSIGQAVNAISSAAEDMKMPSSVLATFQGNAQAFQSSLSSEPILIAAALFVVYIILGVLYESFIHPLTILSTLPSAGVGALLALRVGNLDLSVIGIIGIILLIGIVKKNGIMLVDFAIAAERDQHMPPLEAIRQACRLRFRPILMTTAAAMLAGIPLALGHGTGSEMRQPLGYAMVGGLAVSQMLTLYTTPVVYLYLDRFQQWINRKPRRKPEQVEYVPGQQAAE